MILHILVLTLQNLVIVIWALNSVIQILEDHAFQLQIVVTIVDVIVQLMICYICLTMGSHVHLRKLQMTLDLTTGVPKIVFSRTRVSIRDCEVVDEDADANEVHLIRTNSLNSE